jgi:hypothetical protein
MPRLRDGAGDMLLTIGPTRPRWSPTEPSRDAAGRRWPGTAIADAAGANGAIGISRGYRDEPAYRRRGGGGLGGRSHRGDFDLAAVDARRTLARTTVSVPLSLV